MPYRPTKKPIETMTDPVNHGLQLRRFDPAAILAPGQYVPNSVNRTTSPRAGTRLMGGVFSKKKLRRAHGAVIAQNQFSNALSPSPATVGKHFSVIE